MMACAAILVRPLSLVFAVVAIIALLATAQDADNPWADCTLGLDCPWWDNDLKRAESCTTFRRVPPGVYDVFLSEAECCAAQHPNSTHCWAAPKPPPPQRPTSRPTSKASLYEVVPIEFDLSGLPADVDAGALQKEAEAVIRRALADISTRVPNLKVTDVAVSAAAELAEGRATFFYDVTVLRDLTDRSRRFGPLIIVELRNSYEDVIRDIETYTEMKYFGNGVDFVWCADDACSVREQLAPIWQPVKFNVPRAVDVEMGVFLAQLEAIYKAPLQGIAKLDILAIKSRVDDRAGQTVDIFLTVHYAKKYGVDDLGPEINRNVKHSESEIADEIEAYLVSQTGAGTSWFRNDEGSYTVRIKDKGGKQVKEKEEAEEKEKVAAVNKEEGPPGSPPWKIIIPFTIIGLLFLGLLAVHCVKRHSGGLPTPRLPVGLPTPRLLVGRGFRPSITLKKHTSSPAAKMEHDFDTPITRPPHRSGGGVSQQLTVSRQSADHRDSSEPRRQRRPQRPHDEAGGGRSRSRREEVAEGAVPGASNRPARRRDDTLYQLKNAPSYYFDHDIAEDKGLPALLCSDHEGSRASGARRHRQGGWEQDEGHPALLGSRSDHEGSRASAARRSRQGDREQDEGHPTSPGSRSDYEGSRSSGARRPRQGDREQDEGHPVSLGSRSVHEGSRASAAWRSRQGDREQDDRHLASLGSRSAYEDPRAAAVRRPGRGRRDQDNGNPVSLGSRSANEGSRASASQRPSPGREAQRVEEECRAQRPDPEGDLATYQGRCKP